MKRYIRISIIICLYFLCVLLQGCSGQKTAYRTYSGNVSVKTGLGRESILSEGKMFPVMVHIEGDYAQYGAWCVLSVPTNASDYYAYRTQLTEEKKQDVNYVVPVASQGGQIMIELLDEQERVIYSRTCSYKNIDEDVAMIIWGQIGEQIDSVDWPQMVTKSEETYAVKNVVLPEELLYAQKEAYDMLDFITSDAVYFSLLDKDIKNALLGWAADGGSIVLEGEKANDILNTIIEDAEDLKKEYTLGNACVTAYVYKSGMIWTAEKTLSHIVPTMMDEMQQELLKMLASTDRGGYSASYITSGIYDKIPLIYRLMRQKSSAKEPNVWLYVTILVFYIVLGIPLAYVVSQKKKKVRWFRPLVCIIAVLFSLLIFAAGKNTRYSTAFMKTITVVSSDVLSGGLKETVYAGIQAPFNSSYEVSIAPEYETHVLMDTEYWASSSNSSGMKRVAVISEYEDQTSLSFANLTAFSTRYFEFSKKISNIGNVEGMIEKTDTGLSGKITNKTQFELVSALVFLDDKVALIEHWQPMETIDLEKEQKNARVHMMTLEQFSEGSYQNRGQWVGRLSDYYKYFLQEGNILQKELNGKAGVMAEIAYESKLQQYTQYPIENNSMIIIPLTQAGIE